MQLKRSKWIYGQDEPIKPRLLTAIQNEFIFIEIMWEKSCREGKKWRVADALALCECVCVCKWERRAKTRCYKNAGAHARHECESVLSFAKAQVNCMLISNLYMLKIKARFAPRPFTIYNQHGTLYYIIMCFSLQRKSEPNELAPCCFFVLSFFCSPASCFVVFFFFLVCCAGARRR